MIPYLSVGVNQLLVDIVNPGFLRRQRQYHCPSAHKGLIIRVVSIRHTDTELLQHLSLAAGPFDKWNHGRRIHNISPFFFVFIWCGRSGHRPQTRLLKIYGCFLLRRRPCRWSGSARRSRRRLPGHGHGHRPYVPEGLCQAVIRC